MRTRLFIAIDLPGPLRGRLSSHASACAGWCPAARPTAEENLHVTVAFLGDVEEKDMDGLSAAVAGACGRCPVFDLEFAGTRLAPPHGAPRMVWASFAAGEGYRRLVEAVQGAARPFAPRMSAEKEPLPHVTLCRFPEGACGGALPSFDIGEAGGRFTVSACTLYSSHLRPQGPTYAVVRRFALLSPTDHVS